LAADWAAGVHVARCAVRARYLDEREAGLHVGRAGMLTASRYRSWSTVAAALLLPDLVAGDRLASERNLTAVKHLLREPSSPWASRLDRLAGGAQEPMNTI
jgi:hypothetical protein